MKTKTWLIIISVAVVVSLGLGILSGYYIFRCDYSDPVIIVEPGKPSEPHYYKPPEIAKACGETINMLGSVHGAVFKVLAWDECKGIEQAWRLGVLSPVRHHVIMPGYAISYDIDSKSIRHAVDVSYYYNFGRLMLGAGPVVQFSGERVYQAGARAGIAILF